MLANSLQMHGCGRPNGLLFRPDCAVRTYVPRCEMMVLPIWAAFLWQPWDTNMAATTVRVRVVTVYRTGREIDENKRSQGGFFTNLKNIKLFPTCMKI